MTKMVERVARAILARRVKDDFHTVIDGHYIVDHDAELARAAIAAMREPTDEMYAEGKKLKGSTVHTIYNAMIDAALAPIDKPSELGSDRANL